MAVDNTDVVLLARDGKRVLHVLTVTRCRPPYRGDLALPGGRVPWLDKPNLVAVDVLAAKTGIRVPGGSLTPVGVYATWGRDPRGNGRRTFAYTTLVAKLHPVKAGAGAHTAQWTPVDAVRADLHSMAFDHRKIVLDAGRKLDLIRRA